MMELVPEGPIEGQEEHERDAEEKARSPSPSTSMKGIYALQASFAGAVRRKAYKFDDGNYVTKEWDLSEGSRREFCWYHVELPSGKQKHALAAQYLIHVLCPPLKLQDNLSLISNGPFCGHVDGVLIFRVNSPGPASSTPLGLPQESWRIQLLLSH